jgi:hypothetical protein
MTVTKSCYLYHKQIIKEKKQQKRFKLDKMLKNFSFQQLKLTQNIVALGTFDKITKIAALLEPLQEPK